MNSFLKSALRSHLAGGKQPRVALSAVGRALGPAILATLSALVPQSAGAAPTLRYSVDQRGDMVLLGNSGGFDCRAMSASPDPKLGSVDRANCGRSISTKVIFFGLSETLAGVIWE